MVKSVIGEEVTVVARRNHCK